jgi:hypothetical protein
MHAIERALDSKRSTILFGPLGLRSSTIEFFVNGIPDLIPLSSDEPFFLYKGRLLFLCIEPPFGARLYPHVWQIIFTSHLDLKWDVLHTCTENIHIPFRQTPTLVENNDENILDLSSCDTTHEAFLTACQFIDKSCGQTFSLKCPETLRKKLRLQLPKIGGGPYQSYLMTIF